MRKLLGWWLGVENHNQRLDDLEDKLRAETSDNDSQHERIDQLYKERAGLVDDIMNLEHKVNRLEQELAGYRMTPMTKLIQLTDAINTLTKFANELQREIEEKK